MDLHRRVWSVRKLYTESHQNDCPWFLPAALLKPTELWKVFFEGEHRARQRIEGRLCGDGYDASGVIDAAKTGPSVSCRFILAPALRPLHSIDPFYLTWKAREFGQNTRFIGLAGEINTAMPNHVVNRTAEALNARKEIGQRQQDLCSGSTYETERGRHA